MQPLEESLFQAIKNDDVKAFDALTEPTQRGSHRLGRFPTLSLMYLYKARKLLSAYEERFLGISNYTELSEPIEISKKFSAKAGKCLRLYLNEIVSPLEMLLILDKTRRLKRVYPMSKSVASSVKGRLKAIYFIKYSLNVKFEGNNIVIDKRPLSYREKKKIATVSICLVLAITIAIGVPITTVSLMPKPVEGEVTKLSQIDFTSDKVYTLKRDIALPDNYTVDKVNCTITGEDKKLILGKGVNLGELNGTLYDLTIESSGEAIFKTVTEKGKIQNVTLNVNVNNSATEGNASLALTNYGAIENVIVNVSGKLSAIATSTQVTDELAFGGIVLQNNVKNNNVVGTIKNCSVNYSDFSLIGEASANAVFGGIAGVNNGYLQDCKVTGEIVADTFDIAGICSVNNGVLSGNVNDADLSQTSADTGWNPIVCGIVARNTYVVENCENTGDISSISNCVVGEQEENIPTVSAAGIVYLNSGAIEICKSNGSINAVGVGEAYVGGIAAHSYSQVYNCVSGGDITVTAKKAYAGGIIGFSDVTTTVTIYGVNIYFGVADYCISENSIKVTAIDDTQSYVGGIVGYVKELGLNAGDTMQYFGGCVTNCYFIGEYKSQISYFGNIVGVCGANIYESNSYTSGNSEYYNFGGNYYLNNSLKAFGSTVDDDENYVSVDGKGATSATIDEIKNSKNYNLILSKITR